MNGFLNTVITPTRGEEYWENCQIQVLLTLLYQLAPTHPPPLAQP